MSNAKVWEETWEAHERGGGGWRVYPDGEEEAATFWDKDGTRARLAAAAPEMAQMLRAIALTGMTRCPSCGCTTPEINMVPHGPQALALIERRFAEAHDSSCNIIQVLRKAGAIAS